MNKSLNFRNLNWKTFYETVFDFQCKIAVAYEKGNLIEVTRLQHMLVRSFEARAVAVRQVVTNSIAKVPGLDNIVWNTDPERIEAIEKLRDLSEYKAKKIRKVYIKDGILNSTEYLIVPTIFDRGVQALWSLALVPIAECIADKRSYGFRQYREIEDLTTYLKLVLGAIYAKRWVFLGTITKSKNNLYHEWLYKNIPLQKKILREFLIVDFLTLDYTIGGPTAYQIPQVGVISTVITNMSLDGLGDLIKEKYEGCILVRYGAKFLVIGPSEQILRELIKPTMEQFLAIRGLELMKKINITSIEHGFDFLGFNFKEFKDPARAKAYKKGIFLVQPTKENFLIVKQQLKKIIENHKTKPINIMIIKLNKVLRSWAQYYKTTSATRAFSSIGAYLFEKIWSTLKLRHRGVPLRVLRDKYFMSIKKNNWVFYSKDEKENIITLFQIGWVNSQRHMCCKPLNPFLPENEEYFKKRVANAAKKHSPNCRKQKKVSCITKRIMFFMWEPTVKWRVFRITPCNWKKS